MLSNEAVDMEMTAFKSFINKHPALRKEIRRNGKSWQEIYEKWHLLGEDDPYWDMYQKEETASKEDKVKNSNPELLSQIIKYAEHVDMDRFQDQVNQLSSTISTVQEMIGQFQQSKQSEEPMKNPFHWYLD